MGMIRGCLIAFSMYSKIPVPHVNWEEKDMRYAVCFFPFVGLVTGGFVYLWLRFCQWKQVGELMRCLVTAAIPLVITGGIHLDGFMDTSDALSSYQPRERKLEILKDSHIGAFAVIMVIAYYLLDLAAISEIKGGFAALYGLCFFLSRTLSGLSVVWFQNAKKSGTLYSFSSTAHKQVVRIVLLLELAVCCGAMLFISLTGGLAAICGAGLVFGYYRFKSYREFGGITGDLAGWFLCLCELAAALALAALSIQG